MRLKYKLRKQMSKRGANTEEINKQQIRNSFAFGANVDLDKYVSPSQKMIHWILKDQLQRKVAKNRMAQLCAELVKKLNTIMKHIKSQIKTREAKVEVLCTYWDKLLYQLKRAQKGLKWRDLACEQLIE